LLAKKRKKPKKRTEHGTRITHAVVWGLVDTEKRTGIVQVVSSYVWKEGGSDEIN
jgi:hypothetical protein